MHPNKKVIADLATRIGRTENQVYQKTVLTLQAFTICGPEKEGCIVNQTLRDESCLIPCAGLYADIDNYVDIVDSLKRTTQTFEQHMTKGKIFIHSFCFNNIDPII